MWFQKISIPTPRMVTGNSKGEGDIKGQNFLKEGMKLNWNFQRGGGIQTKIPSLGGVWIFSGTTQSGRIFFSSCHHTTSLNHHFSFFLIFVAPFLFPMVKILCKVSRCEVGYYNKSKRRVQLVKFCRFLC